MSDAPFFEPWPDPEDDEGGDSQEVDLPWMPPAHVAGVVVPVAVDLVRRADLLVRMTHVVAHERGLELHVGTWLRPGTRRPVTGTEAPYWQAQEPRIGLRLADGTRLGHRPPHASPPEAERPSAYFTQLQGDGGGLRSSSSWWLHPLPDGDELEVVVEWQHQGVPETSTALDLAALRAAAAQEEVLWAPPPAPAEGDSFGWFAFAPMSGAVYTSSLDVAVDSPQPEPDGD
jgi:hypothetical protein